MWGCAQSIFFQFVDNFSYIKNEFQKRQQMLLGAKTPCPQYAYSVMIIFVSLFFFANNKDNTSVASRITKKNKYSVQKKFKMT
jgi:hypothetical protein